MKLYTLEHEQWLPVPREEAWEFFSRAENLLKITPRSYGLRLIDGGGTEPVSAGQRITLRIRLAPGIQVTWLTVIATIEPGHSFTDLQERGPFAYWEHRHSYLEEAGGTRVIDHIRYAMPFGWLGRMAQPLVRRQLDAMFAHRSRRIAAHLRQPSK